VWHELDEVCRYAHATKAKPIGFGIHRVIDDNMSIEQFRSPLCLSSPVDVDKSISSGEVRSILVFLI